MEKLAKLKNTIFENIKIKPNYYELLREMYNDAENVRNRRRCRTLYNFCSEWGDGVNNYDVESCCVFGFFGAACGFLGSVVVSALFFEEYFLPAVPIGVVAGAAIAVTDSFCKNIRFKYKRQLASKQLYEQEIQKEVNFVKNISKYMEHMTLNGSVEALKILENKLIDLIKKKPHIATYTDSYGRNIGMIATSFKMENLVLNVLENSQASTQQDENGWNIGMYCAYKNNLRQATLKALDNKKASTQQDKLGQNIGMYAACFGNEEATLKALENPKASAQQNEDGDNIGMLSAKNSLKQATLKALKNKEARVQKNKYNDSIRTIAERKTIVSSSGLNIDNDIDDMLMEL